MPLRHTGDSDSNKAEAKPASALFGGYGLFAGKKGYVKLIVGGRKKAGEAFTKAINEMAANN